MDELQVLEAMGQGLLERGLATPDQVNTEIAAAKAERGIAVDPQRAQLAATQSTDIVTASPDTAVSTEIRNTGTAVDNDLLATINEAAFSPPDSPTGYRFDTLPVHAVLTQEQVAQFGEVRQALYDCGIPAALARQADLMIAEGLRDPPDAARQEQMRQAGYAQLSRRFGDDLPQVLAAARSQFTAIADHVPGLHDAVVKSGLANSPWLIASLYALSQARRNRA